MSLKQWASNGWLRPHETSPQEIQDLLVIVKRDLADGAAWPVSGVLLPGLIGSLLIARRNFGATACGIS